MDPALVSRSRQTLPPDAFTGPSLTLHDKAGTVRDIVPGNAPLPRNQRKAQLACMTC